jgi:FKBP-type peptidyl-prolyl cis-trans isomerase
MEIIQLGNGLPAVITNTVDVDYEGYLFPNGSAFDDGNIKLALSDLIGGWQIAFSTLPSGSVARIYVPSYYGYGTQAKPGIPANSTLVFDVLFKGVVQSSAETQRFTSDTTAIKQYLQQEGITATKDASGLYYVITQEGGGAIPSWYSKIKASYSYRLLTDDSKVVSTFDQTPNENFYNRVVDHIHGLKIGLQKIPVGSKATFYVPSGFAFGPNGAVQGSTQVVPPNANVIVEVDFQEIVQ